MRLLSALAASLLSLHAQAHSGHGAATEAHWHASDTYGFLMVAALAGLAVWLSRGE